MIGIFVFYLDRQHVCITKSRVSDPHFFCGFGSGSETLTKSKRTHLLTQLFTSIFFSLPTQQVIMSLLQVKLWKANYLDHWKCISTLKCDGQATGDNTKVLFEDSLSIINYLILLYWLDLRQFMTIILNSLMYLYFIRRL